MSKPKLFLYIWLFCFGIWGFGFFGGMNQGAGWPWTVLSWGTSSAASCAFWLWFPDWRKRRAMAKLDREEWEDQRDAAQWSPTDD